MLGVEQRKLAERHAMLAALRLLFKSVAVDESSIYEAVIRTRLYHIKPFPRLAGKSDLLPGLAGALFHGAENVSLLRNAATKKTGVSTIT